MKSMLLRFVSNAYHSTVSTIRSLSWRTHSARHDSAPSVPASNVFISILSPLETYVVSLQSLLIWERPYLSAVSFVLLNCLFWLVVSWNRRFISILALIILAVFLYRTWVNQIWPEIRVPPSEEEDTEEWIRVYPQLLSVPELSRYINDFYDKSIIWWKDVLKLRQANHGLFCLLGCAAFSLLAFVGHVVPGVIIIYIVVLALSLGPGIVLHLIPSTIYDQLADLFSEDLGTTALQDKNGKSKKGCDSDSDLEEFLPETSPDILRQLSLQQESLECTVSSMSSLVPEEEPDDHHLTTIRELGMDSFVCESEESSLYTGLGGFPSVEEENESDLEDDLSPDTGVPQAEENKNGIHFVPTHFKEDSSESESDAVFTEGLSFAPIAEVKEPAEDEEADAQTDVTKKGVTAKPKVSTSSDFDDELLDFEILEESDIS